MVAATLGRVAEGRDDDDDESLVDNDPVRSARGCVPDAVVTDRVADPPACSLARNSARAVA